MNAEVVGSIRSGLRISGAAVSISDRAVFLTVPLPMRTRPALCSLGYEEARKLTDYGNGSHRELEGDPNSL
jgi:hypothetical protein